MWLWISVLVVIAVIAWWNTRSTPERRRVELHHALLRMNLGDEGVVRRLVEYEQERNPRLTTTGCYRAAIRRMRR